LENKQTLLVQLKTLFPNGDPGFIPMMIDLMELHSDKNFEYAHGGDALGNFNRVAGILAQYPNLKLSDPSVVCLVYMLKQLDAVLWQMNSDYEGKIEGIVRRLEDVVVYAGIDILLQERKIGERIFKG